MAEVISSAGEGELPLRKKRGRKRKLHTLVVNVRLSEADYDAYCKVAIRANISVRTAMRYVLHVHAPREGGVTDA